MISIVIVFSFLGTYIIQNVLYCTVRRISLKENRHLLLSNIRTAIFFSQEFSTLHPEFEPYFHRLLC